MRLGDTVGVKDGRLRRETMGFPLFVHRAVAFTGGAERSEAPRP